ncbi:MAG: hypothetical protein AB7L17_02830 [Ilumatobacteraceae bacterium]|jgi:hypothetical protein
MLVGAVVIVAVGVTVAVRSGDDTERAGDTAPPTTVPATTPSLTTTPVTTPPATTSPATVPPSTAPVTTTAPPVAPTSADGLDVLTAGPSGVWTYGYGGARRLTSEATSFAMRLPDGRVLAQRRSGWGHFPAADTSPIFLSYDGFGQLVAEEVRPGHDWGGWVTIHDVNVVDGRTIVLFEVEQPPDTAAPANTVIAEDLSTGETVATFPGAGSGWELDDSRLHLASTGLIVGERRLLGSSSPTILSIGDVDVPSAAALGLHDVYDIYVPGCTGPCQRSFTVSHDGTRIGWLERTDLVVVDATSSVELARVPVGAPVDDAYLELSIDTGYAVVSRWPPRDDGPGPVLVTTTAPSVTELPGALAWIAVSPRAVPPFDPPLVAPVLQLDGCPTRAEQGHTGPIGLYIHPRAGPHPVQLIANPTLGAAGPYAIVERFFTDQRSTTPDPFEPADVRIAGDGQGEASWVLDDGSEVYIRERGFDADQVIALADALVARPTDAAIAGFDLDPPALSGVQIVSETAALTGSAAGTNCVVADAGMVSALVLEGEPVFSYAVALDWAPVPYVVDLGDGRLLSISTGLLPIEDVLAAVVDSSG